MDYKLVEIIWKDAWSDTAHLEVDAVKDFTPAERRDVGYLIKKDKDCVVMTPGLINNFYLGKVFVDGVMVFPNSKMITQIRGIDGD